MTEKNELLKAALKLAEMHRNFTEKGEAYSLDAWNAAIATIEKHRPKPEPVECWVNIYKAEESRGRFGFAWSHKCDAERNAATREDVERVAVHLGEVTPAPEWDRWDEEKAREIYWDNDERNVFAAMAKAHNAEMRRVTGTEGK